MVIVPTPTSRRTADSSDNGAPKNKKSMTESGTLTIDLLRRKTDLCFPQGIRRLTSSELHHHRRLTPRPTTNVHKNIFATHARPNNDRDDRTLFLGTTATQYG
jgi:hypothetical protein